MRLIQLTILILFVGLGHGNLISINVGKQKKKEVGSSLKLSCSYDPARITQVAWTKREGDMGVIEGEEDQPVSLKFTDLKLTDSGNYTCSGLLIAGNETDAASVELIVYAPPDVSRTPKTQNFVIGSNATVICRAEGDPKPSVIWSGQRGPFSFAGDNLVIYNVSKADEGKYKCEADQSTGAFDDATIQVLVNIPPKIHHRKKKKIIVAGESATLSCPATGDPTPTISWFKLNGEGGMTKVSDSTKLTLDVDLSLDGVICKCVASNIAGNDTASTRLEVYVKPTVNVTNRVIVVEGDTAELQCSAQGIPTPTVRFYYPYPGELIENGKDVKRRLTSRKEPSLNETFGTWGSDLNVRYHGNVTVLQLHRVRFTDIGSYECVASNDAGNTSAYLELDVLYSPKPNMLYNKWACENSEIVAELRCITDANPAANFTWFKMSPRGGANESESGYEAVLLDEADPPKGFKIELDGEESLLLINVTAAANPFSEYVCKATNYLGSSNETVYLRRANDPEAPYGIAVTDLSARDVTIEFEVPVTVDYTPYTNIIVTLLDEEGNVVQIKDVEVESDKWIYTHRFTGLEHDTMYSIEAATENCKGTSNTSELAEFQTLKILKPEKVEIISDVLSDSFDRYTIEWTVQNLGGGQIKNITIDLFKQIIDGIDSLDSKLVNTFQVPLSDLNAPNGSYEILGLSPLSEYEIRITVSNDVGNTTTLQKIATPAEPAPTATTIADDTQDLKLSSTMDKLPIIIVVAVLIGIVVIIDLSCCCLKNLGLSYVIYSHTCMPKAKENADIEGGAAHFRQDCEQDDKDVIVDEEKRPLADGMESATNGDPALTKIDETEEPIASNNKEEASSPNGNGTVEGGTESPDTSKEQNE